MSAGVILLFVCVFQISVVPDDIDIIAREVVEFSSKYTYVITSGGVGPTHDDLTFESMSEMYYYNNIYKYEH